ncbi:phosphate binding protein [Gloeothece citriformis PCC 7424]|uniref:Phosphate-binding protein n=1 Tax=Gloeothece citriformis (strain PCC 7424) TaxID=65393 RepID=B7KE35_GLOC7|nr:PstS family phosphate ABC transporter substrate-binding protein [Gloeothece citriformis]ACK71733.1 phosphate binding protein [Gloeothece citriformis PCC 7424]
MKTIERKQTEGFPSQLLSLGIALILVSCASVPEESQDIKIDGSSTVYPITEKVVEEFKTNRKQDTNISLEVSGTTGGFRQFCEGKTDINNASRPILAEEMALCSRNGVSYIELPVAFDALTVVVNPNNTWAKTLTTQELKKMWEPAAEGKISRWNQIRAEFPDRPLNLFGAGSKSGTFGYFNEAIVGAEDASRQDYVATEDDNIIVQGVSQDPDALGYFGLSYYEANQNKLKAVEIDSGKGAIAPTREAVAKAQYQPLARPLFIYVNLKASQEKEDLRQFITFYLKQVEEIVQAVGYIPLTEESYHINEITFNKGEAGTVFGGVAQFNVTLPELQRKQAQIHIETTKNK